LGRDGKSRCIEEFLRMLVGIVIESSRIAFEYAFKLG
jgi:hypothetical protein